MEDSHEPRSAFYKIIHQKCPRCGKGDIFLKNKSLIDFPEMREHCNVCDYKFRREPGFFFGSMYVSYGLAVFQAVITFLILWFVIGGLSLFAIGAIVIGVIILFAKWNYRISRAVWIYIFS